MNWQQLATQRQELGRPFVMAHRGASDILPENSPAAFERAIADGADVLETDIHFTHDKQIVLIHDPTVDRTTDSSGTISEMTLAEVKQCRLSQPDDRQQVDDRVLTLAEYVSLTGGTIPTALELKDPRFADPDYAKLLVDELNRLSVVDIFGVISFELPHVQTVQQLEPTIATGWITMTNPWPTKPVTFVGPLWPLMFLNPFYVAWAHRLGKMVCPLDPWPDKRLPLYQKFGVDMVLTNNPATTLTAMVTP